jgi:flagellar basal body-associated protein FliL
MEAGEPSRKKKTTRQIIIEIFGTAIALTTLALPIILITNFSDQNPSNSTSFDGIFDVVDKD